MRRANQKEFVQHRNHVGSAEFVLQPSIDCYSQLIIGDPVRLVMTKWRSKMATRTRSEIETSTENKRKDHVLTVESKVNFTGCTKRKRYMHHLRED